MKHCIPTFRPSFTQRIPCKGSADHAINPDPRPAKERDHRHLTPVQDEWMRVHKPLYHTGFALYDLLHLPQHLRFI